MNDFLKGAAAVLVALTVGVALGAWLVRDNQQTLGASGTRFPNGLSTNSTSPSAGQLLTTTLKVGSTGTSVAQLNYLVGGTLIGAAGSQTASTTVAYDVAVTGVTSTAGCVAQIATSTPTGASVGSTWNISGCKASTTAAFVTVMVSNYTGGNAIPATAIGSNISIWTFR